MVGLMFDVFVIYCIIDVVWCIELVRIIVGFVCLLCDVGLVEELV